MTPTTPDSSKPSPAAAIASSPLWKDQTQFVVFPRNHSTIARQQIRNATNFDRHRHCIPCFALRIHHSKIFPKSSPPPAIEVLPLAGLSGIETHPAFSLDGNHVAFVLHSKNASGIFTTMVRGEKSLQLTQNSGDCCPRWSPDGRQIAFSRMGDAGADIYIIPATGGTEHRLFSWPSDGRPISAIPWRVNARRTTATRAPSFRPTARKSCSNPITRDTTRFGPATATV